LRVLMVGDVFGKPGRRGVQRLLPSLRQEHRIDLVIANGENLAGGRGMTSATAAEIFSAGVDVITSGNHVWDQKESREYLAQAPRVLRPGNYPPEAPGRGSLVHQGVRVVNLSGRVFLNSLDCPFHTIDRLLQSDEDPTSVTFVDFHAEASSEKQALAWYLDGRVSAVLGTHTHTPTADARILPKGTAYIGDVGMVGAWNSIIGSKIEPVVDHFITQMPMHIEVADGPVVFNSVLVEVDPLSGHAIEIRRIDSILEERDLT
jgi:2',3'-cyclic-nucleotide 2'-phosphodiesterase